VLPVQPIAAISVSCAGGILDRDFFSSVNSSIVRFVCPPTQNRQIGEADWPAIKSG
jgi:hypothetical protein